MSKFCPGCERELIVKEWYDICPNCCFLIPKSLNHIVEEMEFIINLREKLRAALFELEQKYVLHPETMTKRETLERKLWMEHNALYGELMIFMDQYDKKDVRLKEIYQRLYSYMNVVDQIKQLYR